MTASTPLTSAGHYGQSQQKRISTVEHDRRLAKIRRDGAERTLEVIYRKFPELKPE